MEKITVWTNYFAGVKPEVERLLNEGKAVRVGADCIGHTRAWMIKQETKAYMDEVGAEIYEEDWCGAFYYLKSAQKPVPKKRGRKLKKERL